MSDDNKRIATIQMGILDGKMSDLETFGYIEINLNGQVLKVPVVLVPRLVAMLQDFMLKVAEYLERKPEKLEVV